MTNPKFKSRENDHIVYQFESPSTGVKVKQEFWNSRSTAVVAFIFVYFNDKLHVLITKRSDTMMDSPGLYCVPSGYLNWDENGHNAMMRELYEETGLYLPDYDDAILFDNDRQPFYVNTNPSEVRQNVSLLYITVLNIEHDRTIKINEIMNDETTEVRFMSWDEFEVNNLEWAFNHDRRIRDAMIHYSNNIWNKI